MKHVKERINCTGMNTYGLSGKGIGVAILDTGIYPHEDFDSRITGFADMVGHRQKPYDDNSHGTHISAIIGGSGAASKGRYCGIAYKCNIIGVKVLDSKGNGFASDLLAGIKWVREHKDRLGIRIVNISVGSFHKRNMSEDSILVKSVDSAWDDGLIVVVAAGNNGPEKMTITTPGISRKVITVGCSDDDHEVDVSGSKMIDYSGRGPTVACICKPDIVAPGSDIISCGNAPGKYMIKSGTSMSTPVVSGAIALLLEKEPGLTNKEVKLRLRDSAKDLGLPKNQQGWGEIDIKRLLRVAYEP